MQAIQINNERNGKIEQEIQEVKLEIKTSKATMTSEGIQSMAEIEELSQRY